MLSEAQGTQAHLQWVDGGVWTDLPESCRPFPTRSWDRHRKESKAWPGCCPEKVGDKSRCKGGSGGLDLGLCWSRDVVPTLVFEKCQCIPPGTFCNSFLLSSCTLFIYLSLCSPWNDFSHMSVIGVKPWALHPAQVFVFVLLSSCSTYHWILTLWPDSYPVVGVTLHSHPPFPRKEAEE